VACFSRTRSHAVEIVGTPPEFNASAYVWAKVANMAPVIRRPLRVLGLTAAKTFFFSWFRAATNSGRNRSKGCEFRSRSMVSSSAGRTSVTQSRARKNVERRCRIWLRLPASVENVCWGLRASSRYWRSSISLPSRSRRSVKSLTTQRNEGKCSASAESSGWPPRTPPGGA